ncbi:MAG: helix-turn-helix domain-containing protein [Lachnospiraceae bacterium]|nr:helix-turn-helix domain-containing protein [Lachnospiraceae bacterium]
MIKETYLINEAAKEVHVEAHVLRYWEEELELPIKRNEQGHRIYSREDIDKFIKIKDLKSKGLQLKAVKTFLEDNPFAQKHFTRLSKTPAENTLPENMPQEKEKAPEEPKKTIEIKSVKSIMKPKNEISEVKPDSGVTVTEQTQRLQYLFQKLIKEAVSANNEEMADKLAERISCCIRDDVCKEMDYQFRLFEERDEERASSRVSEEDKRNEEYYRRIDELLCRYRGKVKVKPAKKEKEKEEKTIKFPLAGKEKEPKAKKEFHLFKKTPEAKFQ